MAVTFTNKHNLPQSFVNAITTDNHVSLGDISVTQLIDAPQIRMLKKLHDYEMDVMDLIAMMIGTGLHKVLEEGDMKGTFNARTLQKASGVLRELKQDKGADYLLKIIETELKEKIDTDVTVEKTLTIEVAGWVLSGTGDRHTMSLSLLEDYKTATASAVMYPEIKKMWNKQLNVYAVMYRENGMPVDKARIIAILKDWSKMKIMQNKDYPKVPVLMHDIPILDHDKMFKYIEKRIKLHQRAEAGESIPCTANDRWAKPDMWAVKKVGGKRAMKLFLNDTDPIAFIEKKKDLVQGELFVEHRKGESFRCANGYCPVSDVCPQYKEELRIASEEAENL